MMEVGAFHMDLALFHYEINDLFKFNCAASYYVSLLKKGLSDRNPEYLHFVSITSLACSLPPGHSNIHSYWVAEK